MKIAVMRCVGDSEKLKYRSMKERYRHNYQTGRMIRNELPKEETK